MRRNVLKLILVLSLILNFSMLGSAAYTHYRQSRSPHAPPVVSARTVAFVRNCLFRELSLKPEQMSAMEKKATAFHAEIDGKRKQIDEKRGHLLSLLAADSPDSKAIEAAVAEISRLQEGIQKTVVAHIIEFKSMLDKKQQEKFLALMHDAMSGEKGVHCP